MVRGAVKQIRIWPQNIWQKLSQSKLFILLVSSGLTVPALVFVSFFVLSLGIGGPAYMSDEVGYLDKAATIAGSTVHLSTSWFAGYSFMISPAFFISSNPFVEWNIILILNALMWAGCAALLQYMLGITHPKASKQAVFLATLGAMLYPSWLSMSGYAFATSGFVLVMMAALASIIKSKLTHLGWLSLAGVFAGYLCWIHPFGFLFLGAFMALLIAQSLVKKNFAFIVILVGSVLLGLAYLGVIQPWLGHVMNGSLTNDSHYAGGFAKTLNAISTPQYWVQVTELLIGSLFFAIVASFGLIIYGALPIVADFANSRHTWRSYLQDSRSMVMLISLLLVVGVISLTIISGGADNQLRMDQWVYGRYIDMFVLPLIGFGLLANWRSKQALIITGFAATAGVLLSVFTNTQNTSFIFNNKANIQGLWPMHLASVIHANNYWVWGVMGAFGVLACGFMGTNRRKIYLPILLVPIMLAGADNYLYQKTLVSQHASVSSLYQYIQTNYAKSDCIGFTPEGDNHERFNLYSYYLHGYDIKKMTVEQWQQQDCKGPYMTYDSTLAISPDLQITGVEAETNLYMITRGDRKTAFSSEKNRVQILSDNTLVGYAIVFK